MVDYSTWKGTQRSGKGSDAEKGMKGDAHPQETATGAMNGLQGTLRVGNTNGLTFKGFKSWKRMNLIFFLVHKKNESLINNDKFKSFLTTTVRKVF